VEDGRSGSPHRRPVGRRKIARHRDRHGALQGVPPQTARRLRLPKRWRDGTRRWSDAGGRANRRHADAEEARRARVGLASESPAESRHPEATLQPRERGPVQRSTNHELYNFDLMPSCTARSASISTSSGSRCNTARCRGTKSAE
jgi:hypothetical protein